MNYTNYDEYIRSLIGYPNMGGSMSMSPSMTSHMCPSMSSPISPSMGSYSNMENCSDDLERMYPEVYRVVYPMVCFACDNIRTPVTEEMVDIMTNDIYDRVESDGRINVDISIDVRNEQSNNGEMQESRQQQQRRPRRRNRFLRDLIRILLLRELLRRRQRRPF